MYFLNKICESSKLDFPLTFEFSKEFTVDEQDMTRYIIGTMARYEYPYTASMKGKSALSNYYQNITEEDAQRIRKEILSTTPKDIKNMMQMIADVLDKNYYCVFGNEQKIKESKDLFTKLIKSKD